MPITLTRLRVGLDLDDRGYYAGLQRAEAALREFAGRTLRVTAETARGFSRHFPRPASETIPALLPSALRVYGPPPFVPHLPPAWDAMHPFPPTAAFRRPELPAGGARGGAALSAFAPRYDVELPNRHQSSSPAPVGGMPLTLHMPLTVMGRPDLRDPALRQEIHRGVDERLDELARQGYGGPGY